MALVSTPPPEAFAPDPRERPLVDALAERLGPGSLHAFFQPAVALADGHVAAVEALCRWEDYGGRLLAAGALLTAAEAAGVMRQLAAWTVGEAARAAAVPAAGPPPVILVNVSASQLDGFRDLLAERRAASGLGPERIGIEVPEDALADAALAGLVADVAAAGTPVYVGRFGCG